MTLGEMRLSRITRTHPHDLSGQVGHVVACIALPAQVQVIVLVVWEALHEAQQKLTGVGSGANITCKHGMGRGD